MKAVIVDLNGNDAVALRDDGQFVKLKNYNYTIGQEITIQAQTRQFTKQAAIAASAAVILLSGGGFGAYTWNNPVSYVSLDINPSIEYSLNAFDRVIAVTGMNEEGVAVVDAMGNSLKNVDITTALSITVEQLSVDAYLDANNTNYMVIGVYSNKTSKADSLISTVDNFVPESTEVCSIATVNVTKEIKATADSYGITGGKMELISEIANVSSDPTTVDPAALADLTVAELEQTKEQVAADNNANIAVASEAEADTPAVDEADLIVSDNKEDTVEQIANGSDNASEQTSVSKDDSTANATGSSVVSPDALNTSDKQPTDTDATVDSQKPDDNTSNKKDVAQNGSDAHGNGTSEKKNSNQKDSNQDSDHNTADSETDDNTNNSNTNSTDNSESSSDKNSDVISSEKKDSNSSDKKDSQTSDKKDSSSDKKDAENRSEEIEDISAPVKSGYPDSENTQDTDTLTTEESDILPSFNPDNMLS